MQCFNSPQRRLGIILGVLFLSFCTVVLADDIEIDLGTTPTPATQSKSTPSGPQKSDLPPRTSASKPVIEAIDVSKFDGGSLVSISGQNIEKPLIEKISDKKILIKFPKTNLSVGRRLAMNDSMVKTIRSSTHGSTAWVVLDVVGVKSWAVNKIQTGYSFSLSSNEKSKSTENEVVNSSNSKLETGTIGSEKKGFFARLIGTSFKPVDKGIKLVLTLDEPAKYTFRKLLQPEKLVIRFHGTKLDIADKLKKFSIKDVEFLKGGILSMELRQIGPQFSPISEVILSLVPGTNHQIDRDLNQVVITLFTPAIVEKPIERKGNINQLVSMDIQSADLTAVVRTLASEAGFDVDLVSGSLTGVVNEKFKDVPFRTALANLLAPGFYDFEIQGNRIRIGTALALKTSKMILPTVTEIIAPAGGMTTAQFDTLVRSILKSSNASVSSFDSVRNVIVLTGTPSDIADYRKAIKDLKLDAGTESDRITKVVKLNYADTVQTLSILTPYLTPAGRVQQDPRTNNLVIWETASNMGVLLELVKELDVKSPQVLIESNIVEVDKENDLSLGFNWTGSASGNPNGSSKFNNTLQNLGASPSNFAFGTVQSGVNISANLDALETRKAGKIISRPRVATASGVQAEINSVENIIYKTSQTVIGLGGGSITTDTFTTLALPIDLKITPRITDDGRITTVINATVTSQTGPPSGPNAPPPTSIQTATTTITIKNGETIVIGGLVRDTLSDTVNGVPLLMSLPLIGELFQQKQLAHRKVELVIFITPTIIQD
jgi:type II secretory pathway component GspD/PulD (secretin)